MTCVDHEHENGRRRCRSRQLILDCSVHAVHLRRYVLSADIGIVAGKSVALQAEGADPDLCTHVDIAERVEDGSAGWLANNGLVL